MKHDLAMICVAMHDALDNLPDSPVRNNLEIALEQARKLRDTELFAYHAIGMEFTDRDTPAHTNQRFHVTTSFMDGFPSKKRCNHISENRFYVKVLGVAYWEAADVTVLLMERQPFEKYRDMGDELGMKYEGHSFMPHVTVGKGDQCAKWRCMIGKTMRSTSTYFAVSTRAKKD